MSRTAMILAVCCLLMSGCASSIHPLSDAEHPFFDHRLMGAWIGEQDGNTFYLHIGVDKKNRTQIAAIGQDSDGSLEMAFYSMHPTIIDDEYYSNLLMLDESGNITAEGKRQYAILKYRITKAGELAVYVINAKRIDEAIKNGDLKGAFTKEEALTVPEESEETEPFASITHYAEIGDSPENIIQYIRTQDPDQLFDELGTFKKIIPCRYYRSCGDGGAGHADAESGSE